MSSKSSPVSPRTQLTVPSNTYNRDYSPPSPTDTIASGYSSITRYTSTSSSTFRPESYPLPTPSTQFCIALYSYSDPDPAALSFCKNDVIEVLQQHPSGWWDGLAGGVWNGYGMGGQVRRGWVPSNYVRLLGGREEARAVLAGRGKMSGKL
ncbi:cell division control protein 25 [Coprinopsis cinerea AmutBmut pab1-1]|nr:cell division control protein 25 [Coprinopsis cinerea AmutBmut pab1-1]